MWLLWLLLNVWLWAAAERPVSSREFDPAAAERAAAAAGTSGGAGGRAGGGTGSAAAAFASLELNQAFIEARRAELRVAVDVSDRVRVGAPVGGRRVGELRLVAPERGEAGPEYDDPRSVVRFLLSVVESATVYPTEGYFYYRMRLGDRAVSGNLRFTSIDEGVLHVGYFDGDRPRARDVRTGSFGAAEGLSVERVEGSGAGRGVEAGAAVYRVSMDGEEAVFVAPRVYRGGEGGVLLNEGERLVSGVLDESGYALGLVFDESSPGFRYVLAERWPAPEPLRPLEGEGEGLVWGLESGFVFLAERLAREAPAGGGGAGGGRGVGVVERERLVLVGVRSSSVLWNDYFDGPFDQVPPDLRLRELLHRAYPYTREVAPVDEHGRFEGRESSRVAIAPYVTYRSLDELVERYAALREAAAAGAAGDGRRVGVRDVVRALTREYQQGFMPRLRADPTASGVPVGDRPLTLREIMEANR